MATTKLAKAEKLIIAIYDRLGETLDALADGRTNDAGEYVRDMRRKIDECRE